MPPLQGLIIGDADSQGAALCYNISPLQGFKNAPPLAAVDSRLRDYRLTAQNRKGAAGMRIRISCGWCGRCCPRRH
ncbi:MAG: hypothetical protein ACR2P4_02840 [Gammaproteobacteria bacterium]